MYQVDELHSFYCSHAWRTFRDAYIAEHEPVCARCHKIITDPLDLILHHCNTHLMTANYRNISISLNPDNIQVVCKSCHNIIHGTARAKPLHGVVLVYGPPLSGKTTYVMNNMERGDLVVDMDRLYAAVSLQPVYDKPDQLKRNVFAMRDLLIDNIKTRYGKWNSAFIIGGYPIKYQREQIAEQTGASIIYCEATKEECMARLEADARRRQKKTEWTQYIESWFEKYTA